MSAARRTQNGASANARRASSSKKRSSGASSRRTSANTRKTSAKRGTPRRRNRSTLAFLIVLGVFLAAVWTLYPVLRLQYQQQRQVASLEAELEGLKDRNSQLAEQIDRLKTPEGVEEAARQNLGLVKDGEQAYVVTGKEDPDRDPDAVDAKTRSAQDESASLWTRVLDALFGVR